MAAVPLESRAMKPAVGVLSVKRTVRRSTASTLSTNLKNVRRESFESGFMPRSKFITTASASKSEPSWNFTPSRSLNV